ncbi:NaeI family type II restriction endonuclease [Streptomyces olivoreticuli]
MDKVLRPASEDDEIQEVLRTLKGVPLASGFTEAIGASIDYVLDGARTSRFDLLSPKVHPGERASVGAKLEYEAQRVFGWKKTKPLDISIASIPIDLKVTVGDNWSIPSEAHCHLCICTQIQLKNNRHRSWLVRTHTSWLYRGKGNNDGKRGLAVQARDHWSAPLYDWVSLPINPLSRLSEDEADRVLGERPGQQKRLLMLFGYLPSTVIPRSAIQTVCAGKQDPVRRMRGIREEAGQQGLLLLCGTWLEQREAAAKHGFTLGKGDWVALPLSVVSSTAHGQRGLLESESGQQSLSSPGDGKLF